MDFDPTEDQRALSEGAEAIVSRHLDPPRDGNVAAAVYHSYGIALERELQEAGFLDIGYTEGLGALEGVLLVERVGQAPSVIEIAASAIVAPQMVSVQVPRPIAMTSQKDLDRAIRYLDVARTLLIDLGDEAAVLPITEGDVEFVPSIYAYNYGAFRSAPDLSRATRLGPGSGARLRLWWQVSLAAEIGTAMAQAVSRTIAYVKERHQFGRPIASFQAVKHRMAEDAQRAQSIMYMARRAAWSGDARDAASAALYAQMSCEKICFDAHQFHGAIGLPLEDPLHFWTMRLRALQGELGGRAGQASRLAESAWAEPAPENA